MSTQEAACLQYWNGTVPIFLFAGDRGEPPHVHIEREDKVATFWLSPVRLQESGGFSRSELSRIRQLVGLHEEQLREAWHEYFGS